MADANHIVNEYATKLGMTVTEFRYEYSTIVSKYILKVFGVDPNNIDAAAIVGYCLLNGLDVDAVLHTDSSYELTVCTKGSDSMDKKKLYLEQMLREYRSMYRAFCRMTAYYEKLTTDGFELNKSDKAEINSIVERMASHFLKRTNKWVKKASIE